MLLFEFDQFFYFFNCFKNTIFIFETYTILITYTRCHTMHIVTSLSIIRYVNKLFSYGLLSFKIKKESEVDSNFYFIVNFIIKWGILASRNSSPYFIKPSFS